MSRKKFISRILTLLLVAMSIFVGSTQRVLAEEEKTFIIGTDTTYAPFEFVDESGEMVGIDMDILAAIAEDQGFNYEIRALGFSAALQALESNQVDGVIAGMGITDERKESFDFFLLDWILPDIHGDEVLGMGALQTVIDHHIPLDLLDVTADTGNGRNKGFKTVYHITASRHPPSRFCADAEVA